MRKKLLVLFPNIAAIGLASLICLTPAIITSTAFVVGFSTIAAFTGCRNLAPEGVYHGDKFLYESELAITTSQDLIHAYVTWEYQNRTALASTPEITKSADAVRKSAKQWFASAHALHDAYEKSPTPENKNALLASLTVIQAAIGEATKYMTTATQPKP